MKPGGSKQGKAKTGKTGTKGDGKKSSGKTKEEKRYVFGAHKSANPSIGGKKIV